MKNDDFEQNKELRGRLATDQQRKASDPNKSVWVQASAGNGKTKVLTDRVLRILLSGGQPGRILCLTYTKAAAVEMNSRISARLSRWAVISAEQLDRELEELLGRLPQEQAELEKLQAVARRLFAVLLDTPGGMKIQTIHSFCQEILKRFPLEAHISPYFEVMDERAAGEALTAIKSQMLSKIEQNPESNSGRALSFLTERISEFSFPKIMTSIAENRNKISQLFGKWNSPKQIIAELARRMEIDPADDEQSLRDKFVRDGNDEVWRKLMLAWMHGSKTDQNKALVLAEILEKQNLWEKFAEYQSCFVTQKGEKLAKPATKDALAVCPEFMVWFEIEVERLLDLLTKLAAVRLLASTKAVLLMAEDLIRSYNQYKTTHSKLDYEDLIVLTRKLLENPLATQWVLFKLDGGIDNVLIDEAQDTSPDQWGIIKALTANFFDDVGSGSAKRTVFAVGDKKQSIYSFQGADPREFAKMERHFAAMLKEANNFVGINLEVSFRSTAAVLDVVNQVFANAPARQGVVEENEDITHIPFRVGEAGKIELWKLTEPEDGENVDIWLPPIEKVLPESTSSRLARQIAERIRQMVEGKDLLVSQNRPIRYRDFMILVQRRNSFVEELVRACKNAGVSIAGVDKIKLLEQIAVQDLISLGKFLLLPGDDLSLAEVLKSPLLGLDDDDLFKLCYGRTAGTSLWARLGGDPDYAEVYQKLQNLLNMADFVRPFELYTYILTSLQGREKFVARLGFEAEDGLDEFVNLTLNFEQEHIPSLQAFVDWVSRDEVEIKRELEQSEIDAVRIMTVHGSKGLQAPVVILPDTVRMPGVKNESGMLWEEMFYYPLSAQDYDANCKRIKADEKKKVEEEYRRLLYVALTRAEDRLYVCGYYKSKKTAPKDDSWYKICEQNVQQIGSESEKGQFEYATEQQFEPKIKELKPRIEPERPSFEWLYTAPTAEPLLAKPYSPSKMEEDEPALVSPLGQGGKSRYRRGLIIHKLLQFMPEVQEANKGAMIEEFLQRNAPEMSKQEILRIQNEVMELLENPQFSSIFGLGSKAEVPIMGLVEGKIISGQVDRLVVEEQRVLIVDYKTNRPAAASLNEVPAAYFRQMAAYRALLAQIYPGKEIQSLILWTDSALLMLIE